MTINIGEFIWTLFNNIISFFTTLYSYLTYQLTLPSVFTNALKALFSQLQDWDGTLSIMLLASGAGVIIALILMVYYIIKGFV